MMATDPAGVVLARDEDFDWTAHRNRIHAWAGITPIAKNHIELGRERQRREATASGQLRIGRPGDWFATIHWSDELWKIIRPGRFTRLI